MPLNGQAVQIAFVEKAEAIAGHLWQECFPPPLEGRFWYQTLEACGLEDQFRFQYAVLSTGGRPVGIAPCFLHDVPMALVAPPAAAWLLNGLAKLFPRAGYQRTFFVGSPCADEGTIGLVAGVKLADVIGELVDAIEARAGELRATMIVFKDFPETELAALAKAPGFCATLSYPGTVVPLPVPDKEAYYRALAHKQRHNLLKKLRQSRGTLTLETRTVKRPSDAELAEIFGLFRQTYERGKTKFERLGPCFFEAVREDPAASFILQRAAPGGALVAFMLVFRLGHRVINKFIGLDYHQDRRSYLYFRLFDAALDFAYAAGAGEIQSGQTGYSAKLDLGHRLVPLFNVFRHRNPLVHSIFRAVGRRITWTSLDHDLAVWLKAHPEREWGAGASKGAG
jgi:hypothetical protein